MRSVIIITIIVLSVVLGLVISSVWNAVDKMIYPCEYTELVEKYAAEYAVPEHLIDAGIKSESDFDSGKTGADGGVGLMGVFPEEFRELQTLTKEKLAECEAQNRPTLMTELIAQRGKVNGRTAFDAMRAGDEAATEVVNEYVKYLASGLASMVNIFQPEVLSIGGGISNEGQFLLDLVTPLVREQQYGTGLVPNADIRIAQLRNDAGIIGAAVLGM